MTPTPNIQAAAMRARAAESARDLGKNELANSASPMGLRTQAFYEVTEAILALPLEADHTAVVAEARRLPEVAALIEAAKLCSDWDEWALQVGGVCPDRLINCMGKLRIALLALDTL